tara:strand:- start:4788 stop:6170 length:1383 start_codon:yes stop_codon:yes gene_type:complete
MALTGIELAGSVLVGTTSPVDIKFGPFNGATYADAILLANTEVNSGLRYKGLTVGLTKQNGEVKEYWYKNGVTDADLVEKSSGSGPGGAVTMQDVYDDSATGLVEAADYTKSLNLVNNQFFLTSNDQTDTPIASTSPMVTFDMSTTTTAKQLFASSITTKDDDNLTLRGRAVYGSFNAATLNDPLYHGCSGFFQAETYGDQTTPLAAYIVDFRVDAGTGLPEVQTFTSGSGALIKGIANEKENAAIARLQTEQVLPLPNTTTDFAVGYVEVATIPVNSVGGGTDGSNTIFSVGTNYLNLLDSVQATNSGLDVKPGDILSIKYGKLGDQNQNQQQISQVEAQSITPNSIIIAPGNRNEIDRLKSPTCYVDTQEFNVTLDLINVKNGQYGTIVFSHKALTTLTIGTVNGLSNISHMVVNNGNGQLPFIATTATEVYTYLFVEEDDQDEAILKMYWTYGLNYT